ncbi:MAG: FtsW/RodA/SpoVE family cell cycle protein [Clostridium sp.]
MQQEFCAYRAAGYFKYCGCNGLMPTTGVTLPFISYGGTAIVILLAEMGIALGISSKIRLK